MNRIRNFIALLRQQLWVIPMLMCVFALLLAYALVVAAPLSALTVADQEVRWLFGGDAATARGLLSSLLTGHMTMTSLVVSMTFIILPLAANQLGPRLVTNFLADRLLQAALGLFIGTILYLLVVLGSLDEARGSTGVPRLAVTVGGGLTVLCLFALLFYVDKVARWIIADNIVEEVSGHLRASIHEMLPEGAGGIEADRRMIALGKSGYIQTIDYEELVSVACRNGAVFQINVRAGHYVLKHGEHVVIRADPPLDEAEVDAVRAAFVIGAERSPAQDLEYHVRQLVEIGLRALSTGINDPFTAIAVIRHLGGALEEVFRRSGQPTELRDGTGAVRVVAARPDIGAFTDAAFDGIRQAGGDIPAVLIGIADVLGQLAPVLGTASYREAVLRQLGKVEETARAAGFVPGDEAAILERIERARAAVNHRSGGCRVRHSGVGTGGAPDTSQ
jgi:uncharacterized membrane protein